MDWSQHAIPPMRLEPRFGDRVVPAFCERPKASRRWWPMRLQQIRTAKRWFAVTGE